MGSESEQKDMTAFERKDFLWRTDKNNWHIERAKLIRKKYPQIKELETNVPSSIWYFVVMTVSHWCMAVLVANYFEGSFWPILFTGWFVGGYWGCAAGLAIHEVAHSLVFTGKWPCIIAGAIAECPLLMPAY